MPTTIMTDPSHEELLKTVRGMLDKANKGCRSRTVEWSESLAIRCEAAAESESEGVYQDDGGTVAKAYSYVAETTAVFLAWSGRPGFGRKVRITIGRVDARKRSRGEGGGGVTEFRGTPEDAVAGRKIPAQLTRA